MGFWHEVLRLIDQPADLTGKGVFRVAKGITGSDKVAGNLARATNVSQRVGLYSDPLPFRESYEGSDLGMDQTSYRKAKQSADWIGSAIGSLFVGGALGGGGAAAGEGGGGATITGGSGSTGLELEAAAGTGQGSWAEPAAGGFNWQNLVKNLAGKGGQGAQQGSGVSVSYLIAQQQAAEAARQAQEMLGGDTNLIDYMARMQMQNNIRRAG